MYNNIIKKLYLLEKYNSFFKLYVNNKYFRNNIFLYIYIYKNILSYLCIIRKKNLYKRMNTSNYALNMYNIVNKTFNVMPSSYLNNNNVYFFWYFFNQDHLIKTFINIIMKSGKKYSSYKTIYKCMFYLKKITGLQPIIILKQFLIKNRFLFDIVTLTLKYKVIKLPKLLSSKSQITKSIKYLINNPKFKKINHLPMYKKLGLLLLNTLFNKSSLNKIIKKDNKTIRKNFNNIRKEELFHKYIKKVTNIKKTRLYRIKPVSKTNKMKKINKKKILMKQVKDVLDIKKYFLLNRYNINISSKSRLRSKWF